MIKQLLNSAIAKYRDLSVARRSIICLCLRHRQTIDLLATDKSRYFAQSRPIIAYYYILLITLVGPHLVACWAAVGQLILSRYLTNPITTQ